MPRDTANVEIQQSKYITLHIFMFSMNPHVNYESCHKDLHGIDRPQKKHKKRTAHLFPISDPNHWVSLSTANHEFDKVISTRPLRPPGKL